MARDAFRRAKWRRAKVGEGEPTVAYTPQASFRYQWEDTPTWEKVYHVGMYSVFLGFSTWVLWSRFDVDPEDWAQSEAQRRQLLKREAADMMVIKPEGHGDASNRSVL